MTPRTQPRLSQSASVRWAMLGAASAMSACDSVFCRQYSARDDSDARKSWNCTGWLRAQTPPGERKSGIPLSVLIPAPVKQTADRAPRIQVARRSTVSASTMHSLGRGHWKTLGNPSAQRPYTRHTVPAFRHTMRQNGFQDNGPSARRIGTPSETNTRVSAISVRCPPTQPAFPQF